MASFPLFAAEFRGCVVTIKLLIFVPGCVFFFFAFQLRLLMPRKTRFDVFGLGSMLDLLASAQ